jgi:hypothetical protein
VKKKELDNLILNEIFGFGKKKEEEGGEEETSIPGIISKGSPISDKDISQAARQLARGEREILNRLLKIKQRNPNDIAREASFVEMPDMRLQDYEKTIQKKRLGTLNFYTQIQALTKIRNKLLDKNHVEGIQDNAALQRDYDFVNMLEVYKQLFMGDDKPKEPEDKSSTSGEVREVPRGELKPVSGEVREVPRGELTPVSGDQRKPQTKSASAGSSLQINPKKLTDEEYVSKFAELVKKYMLLEPATEEEAGRQVGKILDFKKQMNDLMKQGAPGAKELHLAIKKEIAPLQRKMQQVAENLLKENFEQIIREELKNYIKEKK